MNVSAPGKLVLLAMVLVGCFVLLLTGSTDQTVVWSTITAVIGYLIGNGAGARKGVEQEAVFSPKERNE